MGNEFEMAPCDIVNCVKGGCTSDAFLTEVATQYRDKKGRGTAGTTANSRLACVRSGLDTPPARQ